MPDPESTAQPAAPPFDTSGRAFVIRGFGRKTDSAGNLFDFDAIHAALIKPAIAQAGLAGDTTGSIVEAGNIRLDMFALILEADLVICDISTHNANVFYELGIRHALRKKRSLMIKADTSADNTPFDIAPDRYLLYHAADPSQSVADLVRMIRESLDSERPTDSPVFQLLPQLREQRPALTSLLPIRIAEEVETALKTQDRAALIEIARKHQSDRFMWSILGAVGQAQWILRDYVHAVATWETIRATHPNDEAANLALANLFERLHRKHGDHALLVHSDQALERVLANPHLDAANRTEVHTLQARNLKSAWRASLAVAESINERRQLACSQQLIAAYEGYRNAYQADLNAFYPGDNAIQLGTIALSLAKQPQWYALFDSDPDAEAYTEALERDVGAMSTTVGWAIARALQQDKNNRWALASKANLRFIQQPQDFQRLVAAYRLALPTEDIREREASTSQLELFRLLDINSVAVQHIFKELGHA